MERSGATSCLSCPPGCKEAVSIILWNEHKDQAYHHSAFPPTAIPVARDVSHPISLSPDARSDTDLRIQLHAHLKVALEDGFGDRKGAGGGGVALEADHGVVIALLGFGLGSDCRSAIDGFVKDGIVRVMLFHGTEVIGTLEQVLTLTGGIFCANGLTVDALCGETLCIRVFWISIVIVIVVCYYYYDVLLGGGGGGAY